MLAKQEENQAWELLRKDYGERTAAILQEFGEDGLNLAEKYGDDLARIIDNLEQTEAKKAVNLINSYGDEAFDLFKEGKGADEVKKIVEGGCNTINGLKIIDGKVDGKIPLAEYEKYRVDSVHNADSNIMTLGKYEPTIRADGTNLPKNKLNDEYIIDDNMDFLKKIII